MKVNSLRELEKLVRMMRKTGINAIKIDGIELELGAEPLKPSKTLKEVPQTVLTPGGITDEVQIPTDFPTPEQLLYWSAEGTESA